MTAMGVTKRIDFQFGILDCGEEMRAGVFEVSRLFGNGQLDSLGMIFRRQANPAVVIRFNQQRAGAAQ